MKRRMSEVESDDIRDAVCDPNVDVDELLNYCKYALKRINENRKSKRRTTMDCIESIKMPLSCN